jgi:hypothetical protein
MKKLTGLLIVIGMLLIGSLSYAAWLRVRLKKVESELTVVQQQFEESQRRVEELQRREQATQEQIRAALDKAVEEYKAIERLRRGSGGKEP